VTVLTHTQFIGSRVNVILDLAFSILRMPFGTPKEEHFEMLEEALGTSWVSAILRGSMHL
jgi:hypothetical protein